VRLRDDKVAQGEHDHKHSTKELEHEDGEGHEEHEHDPHGQQEGHVQYGTLLVSLEFLV
jgi:hypothetical protein